MLQTEKYHRKFWRAIEDHYGTVMEFAKDTGISYRTARNYMMNPGSMRLDFVRNLEKKMAGKKLSEVIYSEGEE